MKHIIVAAVAVAMAAVVGCSDSDKSEAPKSSFQAGAADLKSALNQANQELQNSADQAGKDLEKAGKDVDAKLKDAAKALEK